MPWLTPPRTRAVGRRTTSRSTPTRPSTCTSAGPADRGRSPTTPASPTPPGARSLPPPRRSTCASVRTVGGAARLVLPSGTDFALDVNADAGASRRLLAWCRRNDVRLAPRALTLTMFFRLLLADQFVHGIGGGRYDQVTDDVIHRHFGLEPPRFAVTTATLYFPAAVGQRRVNLRPLLQEGRRIRHGLLSKEKMSTVQRIDALPRRSRERQNLFLAMHR